MTYKQIGRDIILTDAECFSLELTLDCGQAFRWEKQDDGSFSGVAGNKFLNIYQNNNNIIFKNTSLTDFETFWFDYFDLSRNYKEICNRLCKDKILKEALDEYYGIRILSQDPWETLCSFVISQQNNIKRIKLIIKRLCETYGENKGEYFTFPAPQKLSSLCVKDFEKLGLGYRSPYIEKLAKDVASKKIDLKKIKNMPFDDAKKELLTIYGVGEKVASCVLLFGFGFYNAFPLDVWMKRVMAQCYPDGLPKCFNGYEGIAQQYLFHWARNNLQK